MFTQTTVAQPVTQMFKIHAGVSAAEAEARMAHDDLDRARNEVSLNVKKLYYGLCPPSSASTQPSCAFRPERRA